MQLRNKVALVTAGASSLGSAICRSLAEEGMQVAVSYRHDEAKAKKLAKEIGGVAFRADLGRQAGCKQLVASVVKKFGRLDLLVNNAGSIEFVNSFSKITEKQWHEMIGDNASSAFFTTQAAAPHLTRSHGSLIFLSSTAQFVGKFPSIHYNASKGAVDAMVKSFAHQLAPEVRVNAVAPGFMLPNITKNYGKKELVKIKNAIPLARFGTPEDVARAVVFLAKNDYIAGQTLFVDGGRVI